MGSRSVDFRQIAGRDQAIPLVVARLAQDSPVQIETETGSQNSMPPGSSPPDPPGSRRRTNIIWRIDGCAGRFPMQRAPAGPCSAFLPGAIRSPVG